MQYITVRKFTLCVEGVVDEVIILERLGVLPVVMERPQESGDML
jgi:hypothetical protein